MAFIKNITANTITLCLENTLSDDYKWTWTVSEGLFPCQTEEFWNPVSYDGMRTVNCLLLKVAALKTGGAIIECRYSKEGAQNEEASRVTVVFSVDWDLSIKNCELCQNPGGHYSGLNQKNPNELEYGWSCCPAAGPDHWSNLNTVTLPSFLQKSSTPVKRSRPHDLGESVSSTCIIKAKYPGAGIITFTYYDRHHLPNIVVKYYVSAQSDLSLHIDVVLRYMLSTSLP